MRQEAIRQPRVAVFLRGPSTFLPNFSSRELLDALGGNSGNAAFLRSTIELLPRDVECVGWSVSAADLSQFDLVVVPAANFLHGGLDLGFLADTFRQARVPTLVLGLGLQTSLAFEDVEVPRGTLEWLEVILKLAPGKASAIHVRGRRTQDLLERFSIPSVIGGCPSVFLNGAPTLGQSIEKRAALVTDDSNVAVIPAGRNSPEAAAVDRWLWELADESHAPMPWITQDDIALVRVVRNETVDSVDELRAVAKHHAPFLEALEFKMWVKRKGAFFADVSSYGEHLRRFDWVASARIHGSIIALQSGVPAVTVIHDGRVAELAETLGIPKVQGPELQQRGVSAFLGALSDMDGSAFDANRARLANNLSRALVDFGLDAPEKLGALNAARIGSEVESEAV